MFALPARCLRPVLLGLASNVAVAVEILVGHVLSHVDELFANATELLFDSTNQTGCTAEQSARRASTGCLIGSFFNLIMNFIWSVIHIFNLARWHGPTAPTV